MTGLTDVTHQPLAVPQDHLDLDDRIQQAEQRLIAREQRLRGRVQALRQQASAAAAPRALILKVAGVALAGAALIWAARHLLGRGAARSAPVPSARPGQPSHLVSSLVLSLLPMAWPLLPARWRARVSPSTAATALGFAVPVIHGLWTRRQRRGGPGAAAAPPTVAKLDLLRYAGTWHEQARLPQPFERVCEDSPRAIYTPQGGRLGVRNECRSADGRLRAVEGVARVVPGSGGARLQVTFMPGWLHWLPLVWADLWVLHVDDAAADYRVALAGHPSRQGLWLLSRSPQLPAAELQRLMAIASDLGYDTSRLVLARTPAAGN